MNALRDKVFAIVDVETTGSSPTGDRIIEIGILRVLNGKVVQTFETLIDPERYVPPTIESITGIKASDLEGAPTFADIRAQVAQLLEGAVFVAHNARFDYGFIKNEFKREGVSWSAKCLCTVRLSRKLYSREKRHDLSSIIERFGFECPRRHRAFDDARVLFDFLNHIERSGREEELKEAVKALLQENTLPQFLDEKSIRALPEGPGVYTFLGPEGEVLYVGKSLNIRHRVLSHFSNDHSTTKEMHLCQETRRVEAEETAGELSALLLESELIKALSPLYNRQLRRRSELVVVKGFKKDGYMNAKIERLREVSPEEYKEILAIFRNVRQAKEFLSASAYEHGLCSKLLGIEKANGACFAHQIGKCSGACLGKGEPKDYNQRVKEVFKKRKLRAWPFAGAIRIEERRDDDESHVFILDNWCLLKDAKISMYDTEVRSHPGRFDYDAYKIFMRYIKNPLNKKRIKHLSQEEERVVEMDSSL
ncbi:GIY-YIG nuclease family protein [Candidatus Parcubacteria bacterium]|nr:GIY-YIG nuclease family protein [Candidatus Parcubacteria bacterium]